MKTSNKIIKNIFWIAAFFLILGFLLLSIGSSSFGKPYNFSTLTLAPCMLLLGYLLIGVGIMTKPL